MLIIAIMKKNFIEFYRNKISLVLLILFPLFFLFIFNMAFGTSQIGGIETYSITIINHDTGIPDNLHDTLPPSISSWADAGVADNVSSIIQGLTYNDSESTPIFSIHNMTENKVEGAIRDGVISVAITFPVKYSLLVLNQINVAYGNQSIPGYPTDVNSTVSFTRDVNDALADIPIAILTQVIDSFHNGIISGDFTADVNIDQQSVVRTEVNSIFDYIASGILVFATVIAASFFSAQLLSDLDQGTMLRIKISDTKPAEYVIAFILQSFLLVMIQQVILIYSAILIFGFDPVGSLMRGYVILLLSSLPMFALIFTAGTVFTSSDTAGKVIGFSSSIIGFASGAFLEMPYLVITRDILAFRSGPSDFLVWDLVPWTHAVNAMRVVLLYDRTLLEVGGDLLLLVLSSSVWLIIALVFYMRTTFRRDY